MRPTRGTVLGNRYQLASRIAIGGMGEVWQAEDQIIGRIVAIKILKDEYLGDPDFLERFRAEARHAALVNHEGIASVYDYGEEDGSAFLVLELVPGESLSAVLDREKSLPADRVLDIVAQTASALHAAHSVGLVHRDIKPGNLLITPDGRVKITDFGIARVADQVPLTATGQVMGTVQYLSPEQASGKPATPLTDIYSLGIVAYEALAGHRPFTGENQVAIAMAQINDAPPPLPASVSEPVQALVMSCLAKKPDQRPQSSLLLATAAEALRKGDLRTAAEAVPAVRSLAGTGVVHDDHTERLDTEGFRQLVEDEARHYPSSAPTRTRSPWTWPLVALIGLLTLVLIATIVTLLVSPTDPVEPTVPPTTTTPTEEPTPTPTDPPTDEIMVDPDDYINKTYDQVASALTQLGLQPVRRNGDVAGDPGEVGRVYRLEPIGIVQPGDSIEVFVYTKPDNPPAPAVAASRVTPDPIHPGQQVKVTWPAYNSCPLGFRLVNYILTIDGGAFGGGQHEMPVGATTTEADFIVGNGASASFHYRAVCDGGLTSSASPGLSITIVPEAEESEG